MTKNIKLSLLLNAWIPPIAWASLIFFLSGQSVLPKFDTSLVDFFFKKLAHISVYLVLYLLFWRAIKIARPQSNHRTQWLAPFLLCLIYALNDELHQSFVPGRSATMRDIGYDTLGTTIAMLWRYRYI